MKAKAMKRQEPGKALIGAFVANIQVPAQLIQMSCVYFWFRRSRMFIEMAY